jgi:predicted esterase
VLVRHARSQPSRGVLVGFHGYMENAAIQLTRLEGISGVDAWTLMSVQALHRFYRGRTEEVVASWMTREDRESAIADNIAYVDAALRLIPADAASRVVYAGFSQGVAMAFRAAARGHVRAAGVVAAGGDVPPELLSDATVIFPPVFLARGAADEWYTAAKHDADVAALRSRGVQVDPPLYDAGHAWTPAVAAAAAAWLADLHSY